MPQLSVTVTADEAREIQERAGSETVSNYVRGRLGLPALARGRSGRQNEEVTRHASEDRQRPSPYMDDRPVLADFPDPATVKMHVPYLNGDRRREDEASDEAHELAYEPVED